MAKDPTDEHYGDSELWFDGEHQREIHSQFRKEGNVLFNNALNTFYLRLYAWNEGRKCFI